jgi:uncharacterized membrane protein YgcG
MFGRAAAAWLPALVAVCLVAPAAARAEGPPVRDEAALFSPAAVAQADAGIEEIRRTEHKDLVIETYPAVPEDQARAFAAMTRRQREDFFQRWADERARARGVDGVFVLICKSPPTTQVTLGPDTEDRVFPERDRDRLARTLTVSGRRKNYDAELLDAVALVRAALHHNPRTGGSQDAGRTWLWVGGVIGGLLLLWVVIGLLRAAVGLRGQQAPAETATPCANHPFVNGVLGGLFGAQASHWLCDSLFRPGPAPQTATPGGEATGDEEAYAPSAGEAEGPVADDSRSELERRAEDY